MKVIRLVKVQEPTSEDKAFLAGVIEADGCISLVFGSNGYYHPRIQIANTSTKLIEWIGTRWAGDYNPNYNSSKCYTLHWSRCSFLQEILIHILPYMVSKKKEAELLLEYTKANKGMGIKSLMSEERKAEICNELKALHNGGRE